MTTSPMRRRSFLAGAGAAAAATLLSAPATATAAAQQRTATAGPVRVRTTAGPVQGETTRGITVFRGVPYAEPPVGRLRFAPPKPPTPWTSVRDATRYSSAFLQPDGSGSEDALYANIWTPHTLGSRPVLVYIHGGGWIAGSGNLATFDGTKLADRGDAVVITFNYRMGAFGFGLHEAFADPATGDCSNWGVQDQIALLRWVRENAAAFGGDPENITLFGTSAGGANTYHLSLLPEVRALIRRIVPISAAHVWSPAATLTPADSRTVYETIATQLGTTVGGLRDVPAASLHSAWLRTFSGSPTTRVVNSGREYRGPVRDGKWLPDYDYAQPSPDLPVMSIHTRTEGSFFTGSGPTKPVVPTNDAELREAVRGVLHKGATTVTDAQVDACLAAYRDAASAEGLPQDPLALWTEIWGDGLFRHQIVRLAERHARQGGSAQYVMEFAHPVRAPYYGTPHEATSKFLFGTHGLPENIEQFGDSALERQVSDVFIDLVASFARGEAPSAPGAPAWPVFSPDRPTAMILGGGQVARVGDISKLRQLTYWDTAGWVPVPSRS